MKANFFALLALCLLAGTLATAAPTGGDTATNNPVLVRGKGFEIRRRDVDQVLNSITVNGPEDRLPPDAEVHVINQLIELQLVWQQATAAEKAAGLQAADTTLAGTRKKLGEAAFEKRLQATGLTVAELRLKLAQETAGQTSLTRQLGVNVTDKQVRKYYDDNPGVSDQPERARVREILLLTAAQNTGGPLPAATVETKHRLIFGLYQRVQAGEDLATLARQYNEDPESKGNAGELPPFRADKREFGNLAFSMQTNQISGVLTNSDGFRFFQLLGRIPAHKVEFAAMAENIKKGLIGGEKRRLAPAYLEKLRTEAGVEILDARLQAMMPAEPGPPPHSAP